jgi:uncharacterized protein YdhG (YjbR/CyaY superfamily)
VQSKAKEIKEYLAELDLDRRKDISTLITLVRESIKPGFDEAMRWGMVSYEIPISLSGPTYNKQPLSYIGIASQKNHISIYLMSLYVVPENMTEFQSRWGRAGKKLDMGKGCVRFRSLQFADLETLRWVIGLYTPQQFLELTPAGSSATSRKA